MPEQAAFGRRGVARADTSRVGVAQSRRPGAGIPAPAGPGPELSAEAEAFRLELARGRAGPASSFDGWRRSQGGRRALVWAVTLASFSPGLVCLLVNAPIGVSIALEAAAFAGNVWLRRERRRRLREIAAWEEPQAD